MSLHNRHGNSHSTYGVVCHTVVDTSFLLFCFKSAFPQCWPQVRAQLFLVMAEDEALPFKLDNTMHDYQNSEETQLDHWLNCVTRCFGDKGDVEDITEGRLTPSLLTARLCDCLLTCCLSGHHLHSRV